MLELHPTFGYTLLGVCKFYVVKDIQLLIDMKVSLGRETLLFQILGKYGDKIPTDLQDDLRKWAEEERNIGGMKKRTFCRTFLYK